jgi:osmotically inducible protein OsmC
MDPRSATAVWKGSGLEGSGVISTVSGALSGQPYTFKTRFQSEDGKAGTNPEELIAAAHAACFSMALSFALSGAGTPPQSLETKAEVSLRQTDGKFKISGIHLSVVGTVSGLDAQKFTALAEGAKAGCPISQALSAVPITLDARLA